MSPAPRPPRIVRVFQVVYVLITANFLLPAISYVVAPEIAEAQFQEMNVMLGGGAYLPPRHELWHMLAAGNVFALAFMCALLLFDVRRFQPVLPALVFLKMCSAIYSLVLAVHVGIPAFYGVFVLDSVTSLTMWFFATRAYRALSPAR
jgi:hypothetical protein